MCQWCATTTYKVALLFAVAAAENFTPHAGIDGRDRRRRRLKLIGVLNINTTYENRPTHGYSNYFLSHMALKKYIYTYVCLYFKEPNILNVYTCIT